MHPTRAELARLVDHTLLGPQASPAQALALCADAVELGVHGVCVPEPLLGLTAGLRGLGIVTGTILGADTPQHDSRALAREAGRVTEEGAGEVCVVIDVVAVRSGSWRAVSRELDLLRRATEGAALTVVLEAAALSDDEVVRVCVMAQEAGANLVATASGLHPAGGATALAVSLMANTVGATLGIKASGGIRTAAQAGAMLAAGATRLGITTTRAVLDELVTAPAAPGLGGAPLVRPAPSSPA